MQLFNVYMDDVYYRSVMADDARAAMAQLRVISSLLSVTVTPAPSSVFVDLECSNAELTIRALRALGGI